MKLIGKEFIMGDSVTTRVQNHRKNLREMGFRPVQIWVRDTRSEVFKAECTKQSLSLHNDPQEAEVLDWMESVQDFEGWEA